MGSPHRSLDPRSGLVLDTRVLGRRAGAMVVVQTSVEAPADLGIDVIGVPPGSPVELDLRLESVMEGVLVTGTAAATVTGECARCLGEIADEVVVDFQELFVYPGQTATEDEASAGWRATCSTSSHCCGTRWCWCCRSSRCARTTAPGLCPECGVRLDDDPGHEPRTSDRPALGSVQWARGRGRQN